VWVESIPTKLHRWIPPDTPLYRSVGCPECAMTGYRGRFSIVEVLTVTPELERRIGAGETADRIALAARAGGMKGLWQSGLSHVLRGESTIDELLRVVDVPQEDTEIQPRAPGKRPSPAPVAESALAGERTSGAQPKPIVADFDLLESAGVPAPAPGTKVLLVDDEDMLRKVMKDLLEREGYNVVEARDGVEALDQVDRHGPDIIVLDLNLPGLDGYGVLSHLRSRPATAGIPVVVLTARGDEENEVRVFEHGADDFLSKPFRARALSARLSAVLGRGRRRNSSN
jgi:CheY-like chemotaxis protein